MRRIPSHRFRVAGRGTSREINRRILLNLVRSHQPVSRADLARMMGTTRAAVTFLVNDLIEEGFVYEGAKGEAARGRKPQFLYIDSRKRWVLAVDIRATRTSLMVCDLLGEPLVGVTSFPTQTDVKRLVKTLAERVKRTVSGSTASTLSTIDKLARAREPVLGSRMRLMVATTSSESRILP